MFGPSYHDPYKNRFPSRQAFEIDFYNREEAFYRECLNTIQNDIAWNSAFKAYGRTLSEAERANYKEQDEECKFECTANGLWREIPFI